MDGRRDDHRILLTDAVSPVDRLILDGRIPPAVEQKHVAGELQIQPHGSGSVAHQQQVRVRIVFELIQNRFSLLRWNTAVVNQRIECLQPLGQPVERFGPLAEQNRLAVAGGDFLHVGRQSFKFRALSGQRIEVGDLLETQHQLKDMLNRDGVAEIIQLNDTFLFSRPIGGFLGICEFQFGVAIDARRHVGHHQVFGATENVFVGQTGKLSQIRSCPFGNHIHELKQRCEFFRTVFDGRAGECPAASAVDGASHLRGTRITVLDSLSFIKHQQIERLTLVLRDLRQVPSH